MFKKKSGFTLSEVLIALTIIGVISALTVPRILGNTTKKQFTTKFKTTINMLDSAAKEYKQEEGGYDYTGDRTNRSGYINISTILQNKLGAKEIKNTGNNALWTVTGLVRNGNVKIDPTNNSSKEVNVFLNDTGMDNSSKSYITSGARVSLPFGSKYESTEANRHSVTLQLNNGAYVFVPRNTLACNYRNLRWNQNGNSSSYLTPELGATSNAARNTNLCFAFIDVNGPKGPNRLTSCTGDTKVISPDTTEGCTISDTNIGDTFAVFFYDDSVSAANTASYSVLYDQSN